MHSQALHQMVAWTVPRPRIPIPRGKTAPHPLDRKLDGIQGPFGRNGEEKKSYHCLHRQSNPGRPGRSLVFID